MVVSKRFKRLAKRLRALEEHFLPSQFSATGRYTLKETDSTKAYVLLVHAELETYFEDRAEDRLNRALRQWDRDAGPSPLLSRLVVYHEALNKSATPKKITEASVRKAANFYMDRLRKNHGVKEANLLALFLPLGLQYTDFDASLMATMDSFGVLRGKLAHESVKTHQPVDPKTERDKIQTHILKEIQVIDRKVAKLY